MQLVKFMFLVMEHSSHATSAINVHCKSNNHPQADISHFRVIDQESKQAVREAIHIRMNKPTISHNTGKMYISDLFNRLLGVYRSFHGSGKAVHYMHQTIVRNRFSR